MTDINEPLIAPRPAEPRRAASRKPRRQADAELLAFAELLFFAYRDFTRDADLLDILKITKQSLGRVLKQLIDTGYVEQRAGSSDRRERLLYTTDQGRILAKRLASPQLVRLAQSLKAAGSGADAVVNRFLKAMIDAEERPKVSSIMGSATGAPKDGGSAEEQ
jgi:DNA-binding MarR family transcriptional regulator